MATRDETRKRLDDIEARLNGSEKDFHKEISKAAAKSVDSVKKENTALKKKVNELESKVAGFDDRMVDLEQKFEERIRNLESLAEDMTAPGDEGAKPKGGKAKDETKS